MLLLASCLLHICTLRWLVPSFLLFATYPDPLHKLYDLCNIGQESGMIRDFLYIHRAILYIDMNVLLLMFAILFVYHKETERDGEGFACTEVRKRFCAVALLHRVRKLPGC